jgi:hypothetical protein
MVAEVIDVNDEDVRVTQARLRNAVRELDIQIEKIRSEDRLFRRCGFGSDLHNIQIVALQAQRQDLLARLGRTEARDRRSRTRQRGIGSWLLLPPALAAMCVRSVLPRRRQAPRPI